MEVVVLPYLISSLVLGLGQLAPENAVKLFRKSWAIYLALWAITFVVLIFVASTVPLVENSDRCQLHGGALEQGKGQRFLPYRPAGARQFLSGAVEQLHPLDRTDRPDFRRGSAEDRKTGSELLAMLSAVRLACIRIWGWVVFLAPIGVCGLFTETIGTMKPDGYAAMGIYIVVVTLSALVLGAGGSCR